MSRTKSLMPIYETEEEDDRSLEEQELSNEEEYYRVWNDMFETPDGGSDWEVSDED